MTRPFVKITHLNLCTRRIRVGHLEVLVKDAISVNLINGLEEPKSIAAMQRVSLVILDEANVLTKRVHGDLHEDIDENGIEVLLGTTTPRQLVKKGPNAVNEPV